MAVTRLLFDEAATLDGKPETYDSNLHSSHSNILQRLLEGNKDPDQLTWFAKMGFEVAVQLLLERGAKLEPRTKIGQTPLSLAARREEMTGVQLLTEHGAEIESESDNNRTPLSWAAEFGHEDVVRLLLEKRAKIDSKDKYSRTPLSWATRGGHEAVVKLLLEHGSEPESEDLNQSITIFAPPPLDAIEIDSKPAPGGTLQIN